MSAGASIVVRVFGTPPARDCPPARTWEAAARWIGSLLSARFGDRVRLEYVDLLGPGMDRFPEIAALMLAGEAVPPVVTVDGVVVTSGSKISMPDITRALQARGLRPGAARPPKDAAGAVWSDVG